MKKGGKYGLWSNVIIEFLFEFCRFSYPIVKLFQIIFLMAWKNFWDRASKIRAQYLRLTFSGKMFAVHLMESKPDENNVKDNTFILSPDKVKYISGSNVWILPNYTHFLFF